jgi:ABC-type branched-subunit amino acid transport system ATPase component
MRSAGQAGLLGKGRSDMLLSLEGVDVHYGHAKVLHAINLHILKGEVAFIVGRNGAGKTTLLKTIAGFLKPSKGSILFDHQPIQGIPPEKVALMGIRYVFQDKRVFGELTVKENIELAAYPTKEKLSDSINRILSLYPRMDILINSKAKGLSGGQRQILLIGRALIGEPKLLLIDEPTEGLSAGIMEEILDVLTKMKGQISMIIVEQNLSVVSRMADRVYMMKEGSILKEITDKTVIEKSNALEDYL